MGFLNIFRGGQDQEEATEEASEVEQYAQSQAIKIKTKSKPEKERRYDRRKWDREGQEDLEKWRSGTYYDQPEQETQSVKKIKVSKYEREEIQPKSVKIQKKKGMDESKARYEQCKADRIMREAKEAGKNATKKLSEKITTKTKRVKPEKVEDKETVEKVDKALKEYKSNKTVQKTRSQELSEIKDKAYRKQRVVEENKRIARENEKAERYGARGAMSAWDAAVDRAAELAEGKRAIEGKITEAREKISPISNRAKQAKSQSQPKITAAQRKRLEQQAAAQLKRSYKALAPQRRTPFAVTRGAPFGVQRNTLAVQKSGGSLNASRTPSFGSQKKGNPFSFSNRGAPFAVSKSRGAPFATGRISNPIGYTSKKHPRLI